MQVFLQVHPNEVWKILRVRQDDFASFFDGRLDLGWLLGHSLFSVQQFSVQVSVVQYVSGTVSTKTIFVHDYYTIILYN